MLFLSHTPHTDTHTQTLPNCDHEARRKNQRSNHKAIMKASHQLKADSNTITSRPGCLGTWRGLCLTGGLQARPACTLQYSV